MSEHVCFVYSVWILYMYFVSCLKTLIGYYCLKWIFGYYCINPSCILQSENVNGTNAGRKSWRRIKVHMCPQLCPHMLVPRKI
uniref:Uncharacterized protein n=1 Tax=Brassica oleracea TaxID=3712 RepID=A0A3P6AT51_BRAOL|nr:unnamed protein product [Brassica oleracea]